MEKMELGALLEALRTRVWLLDPRDQRCLYANRRAKELCEDITRIICAPDENGVRGTIGNLVQRLSKETKFECTFHIGPKMFRGTFSATEYLHPEGNSLLLIENHELSDLTEADAASTAMIMVYKSNGKVAQMNSFAEKKLWPEIAKKDSDITEISPTTFLPYVVVKGVVESIISRLQRGETFQTTTHVQLGGQFSTHFLFVQPIEIPETKEQIILTYETDVTSLPYKKREDKEFPLLQSEFLNLQAMSETLLETFFSKYQLTSRDLLKNSWQSLLKIINMFDIVQFQEGTGQFSAVEFDLYGLLEDCVDFISPSARSRGLELAANLPTNLPSKLIGDPRRMKQILMNLLLNAIQFTQTGEVIVEAKIEKDSVKDVILLVEVTDTGVGLSKDQIRSIFGNFELLLNTFKTGNETGLGLAISKQIVELMGGSIGVRSSQGIGSTFWFKLILDKPLQALSLHPFKQMPCKEFTNLKSLVVTSSTLEKKVLGSYLESWKITPVFVTTGSECRKILLKQALEEPFELIFISNTITDMKASTLAKELQTTEILGSIYPIILTEKGARSEKFATCLTTPIRRTKLFELLKKFANFKRSQTARKRDKEEREKEKEDSKSAQNRDINILVVEDNALAQVFASRILGKMTGCRVEAVANGVMAVEYFKKNSYDIILMDCHMPELDGYAATKQIRELEKGTGGHVIIIAVTAMTQQEDRDRCFQMGMDDYISKPVSNKLLVEKIEQWRQQINITKQEEEFGGFNQEIPLPMSANRPGNMAARLSARRLLNAKKTFPT